ncbi:hypothetical protein [Micromonospora mirobrigensis]|uniref:LPXTG-motif cell wall anchor domain-containing protein n=1 Tax=Micromonospora mirobrigensis TaxID=262898 RepID=A0A1C4VPZ1_9ACTN|nr:hypothetical protein [Micromonospora mirobrigensis]SCE85875.1 hypothetical protein GA0070564_1011354 [Micromonospora mirobrigensis]
MHPHPNRRWLAGLVVAGGLVAASALPAAAAPAPAPIPNLLAQDVKLYANDVVLAPGGPGKDVELYALTEGLTEYTVKVDSSAVAGFAELGKPYPDEASCTTAGAILTCTIKNSDDPDAGLFSLPVSAPATAKVGQRGDLAFTVTAPGAGTATFRSTVTVGEGVDLAAGKDVNLKGAPGATVAAPLTLTNAGDRAVDGAVLLVFAGYNFAPSQRYQNCEYAAEGPLDNTFACTFDGKVAPGETRTVDSSFSFTVPPDAPAPNSDFGFFAWLTKADWQELRDGFGVFGNAQAKGATGTLKLETPRTAQANPQTDTDLDNNAAGLTIEVTGKQAADVAAVGATGKGVLRSTVQTTVGFLNRGPAAVNVSGDNALWVLAKVTVPVGATAVQVPDECFPADKGGSGDGETVTGKSAYYCFSPEVVGRDAKAEFRFGFRIDKAGPLTGAVELATGFDEMFQGDLNPANDKASIVLNPAPAASPTPSTGGTAAPSDGAGGGQGGGLPVTGTPAGLIAGIGGLLLVAGAAGYLVAKRRRTRFVA